MVETRTKRNRFDDLLLRAIELDTSHIDHRLSFMVGQLAWLTGGAAAIGVMTSWVSTLGLMAERARDKAQSDVKAVNPITEVRVWDGGARAPWQTGRLTVPDLNPAVATQNSPLRPYDRQVAKLFELTYLQCQNNSQLQGMQWIYEAANGNVNLGQFQIRCQTAVELVSGYQLAERESTKITTEGREQVTTDQALIPTFDITGTKVQNWAKFVRTIRPLRSPLSDFKGLTVVLRSDQVSGERPPLPLIIPRILPKLSMVKETDRFLVTSQSQGYQLCPTVGDAPVCDRSRVRSFQQFSAKKGGEFYAENKLSARDVYRKIELAQGTPGLYLENCGPRSCTSSVQWKRNGILYEVQAQYREQPILVAIANSAIAPPQTK